MSLTVGYVRSCSIVISSHFNKQSKNHFYGCEVDVLISRITKEILHFYSTSKATFPSFTICPEYDSAYKKNLLAKFGLNGEDVRSSLKFPSGLRETETLGSFFHNVTYDLDEIVDKIVFTSEKKPLFSNFSHFYYSPKNSKDPNDGESKPGRLRRVTC